MKTFGSSSSAAPSPVVHLPRRVVIARVVREVVLWAAAALGVLCLLVAAAAVLFHVTPLVFRSGSMSPGIPTGSVALARPEAPSAVRPGQIVSVVLPDGTRVTHRVVHVTVEGDAARLRLKGDANRREDPEAVVTTAIDRVFWSTPGLGYVLEWATHAPVVFVGGALLGMVAMWGFRRPTPLPEEAEAEMAAAAADSGPPPSVVPLVADDGLEARPAPPPSASVVDAALSDGVADGDVATQHAPGPRHAGVRRARHGPHGVALVAGGVVITLGATILLGSDPARAAAWTDPVTATAPTMTAGTLTAPLSFTCSPTNGITLSWTAPAAASVRPDYYTLGITNSGLGVNLTNPGRITGTSYSFGTALLTVGNTYTFTLTAWSGDNWSSTFAGTRSASVLLGLLVSCNNAQ